MFKTFISMSLFLLVAQKMVANDLSSRKLPPVPPRSSLISVVPNMPLPSVVTPAAPAGQLPGQFKKIEEGRVCLLPPKRGVRILTIDGGGVRGIIPAVVVQEIEVALGLPISKIMDAIGGTSVGGIETLAYTKPKVVKNGEVIGTEPAYRAQDILDLTLNLGTLIFKGKNKLGNLLTSGSLYKEKSLENILEQFYGDTSVSQTLKPVFITAFDVNSEQPFLISTTLAKLGKRMTKMQNVAASLSNQEIKERLGDKAQRKGMQKKRQAGNFQENQEIGFLTNVKKGEWPFNFRMTEAARATSAAPFYFPVKSYELSVADGTKMQLIDGGVGNNNPAPTILAAIDKEYCSPPAVKVISIGTGTAKSHFQDIDLTKEGGALRMLNPTLGGLFKAQDEGAIDTMNWVVGLRNALMSTKSYYKRLQTRLGKGEDALDDTSPKMTKLLLEKGKEIVKTPDFQALMSSLKKDLCDELVYCREEILIKKEGLHQKMCPQSTVKCDAKTKQGLLDLDKPKDMPDK